MSARRRPGFAASLALEGFTPRLQRERQWPGLRAPGPSETHGWCALPSVRPFAASPVRASGERSPGQNALLPRTIAASPSPGPCPQELRDHLLARPARPRLLCGACSSTRGVRSTLPPHARSPSRSCALLRSLWSAHGRTSTSKIAPMLGAHIKRASPLVRGLALVPVILP